ncbi:hypothetical protein PGTUg99_050240 [Puccinia graminis f. sp. tritici]|uniref:CCHC-type domain-containing protein n=1 Tax=Puccinia graminis f. sp. tritici TaxID=56615 RepID=A0A5B0NNI3_PUCGR|nr:hypothetical protein PGTUg99_050240 [Puccinia graminis f. sp. tritici]
MPPPHRPPDQHRPSVAPIVDDSEMTDDLEIRLPTRPATKPPSSSLHILLTKALDATSRDANGAVLLDAKFVDLVLDLSANNERLMQRLENAVDQLNAKNDSVCRRLAEVEAILRTGPKPSVQPTLKPNGDTPKSFAAVTSAHLDGSIHAPKSRPPPAQVIASLKPKRVIIHSNPANTTLKDVPSGALVQKANEALIGLDARVDGESVAIRGASMLPSGDVSFYTKNRAHQKWLMDNKHVWSKAVHPDLEATPSTYSVMAHGVPKSFDIGKPTNLAQLASENSFQATDLARVRWMGSNEPSAKKAGSLVLSFINKDLAYRIEKSGVFLNYDYHRTERFKPRPPQCFKCLRMGHFGKWCREPARCAKCAGKHPTNECPDGIGGVNSCVLCKEGLKNKIEGITSTDHTPFNLACPYKKAWFDKKRFPPQ